MCCFVSIFGVADALQLRTCGAGEGPPPPPPHSLSSFKFPIAVLTFGLIFGASIIFVFSRCRSSTASRVVLGRFSRWERGRTLQ